MTVHYQVVADVVDIQNDQPRTGDAFLVDTNVWFWLSYTKAMPAPYQKACYPPYIKLAKQAGIALHRCALTLSELAHLIEKTERELYENTHQTLKPQNYRNKNGWLKPKEYRHNYPSERASVTAEVKAAWGAVQTMASPVDLHVDDHLTAAALSRFQNQPLDGYDLFVVEAISKAGIVQVLTDDGDFCTVPGIQVFTANRDVISAATSQSRLLQRPPVPPSPSP